MTGKLKALSHSWREILIILSVAGVVTFVYVQRVHTPNVEPRFELHNQIVSGDGPSPYRYRILLPLIAEGCAQLFQIVVSRPLAIRIAYIGLDLVLIFTLLISLYLYCRRWFSRSESLVGTLFVASTIPVALTNHWLAPWSLLEPVVMTLALVLVNARRTLWLAALILFAALNRETAVIIPFVFLVGMFRLRPPGGIFKGNRDVLFRFALMSLLSMVVIATLRLVLGNADHVTDLAQNFRDNFSLSNLRWTVFYVTLFAGVFWYFALKGFHAAPESVRRSALIIPMYLGLMIPFAVWWEVRVLMTLYPILIPLGLAYLFKPADRVVEGKQV